MSTPIDPQKYTAAQAWGTTAKNTEQDLTLPSGVTCRVRKPGMENLMMSGILDMVDSIGMETEGLVNPRNRQERRAADQQGLKTVEQAQDEASGSFMKRMKDDPEMFRKMMAMIDKIIVMTVIIPTVQLVPESGQRVDGTIYVDSIDFEDKFAIMEFGMGDIDKMKQFRDSSDSVGAVLTGESDGDAPVGSPGSFV